MVKIKIHRGTSQIGGTITEIYTENTHIFVDFGSELSTDPEKSTDKKMVEMINNSPCDAVLFSHYHGDHVGLLGRIPKKDIRGREIKLGIGLEARKVMIRIHKNLIGDFAEDAEEHKRILDILKDRSLWIDFDNKKTFTIGDFTITTVRVDHSAYDAYMFIIEAEGKVIVHTGDFRTHGRLGVNLFPDLEEVLAEKKADILLIEGTMMERLDEEVLTETMMEELAFAELAKPENKYAFLLCSSTNMESLASFCNAARRHGRPFVVNHYVYEQIKGYSKSAGKLNEDLRFYKSYPFERMDMKNDKLGGLTQPEFMLENGFVMLIGTSKHYKERVDYFKDCNPLLIYSMWEGYVNKDKYPDTYVEEYGKLVNEWRCYHLHTSGHATPPDIEKMINLVEPKVGIIPIHTTRKEDFEKLNIGEIKVLKLEDGDKYEL